ncbi:MAG: hypothetical protein ISP24_01685 [Rickettsiales bacterium]|nr:hypothetical protein [Rickettsiales bacterium]
MSSSENTHDNPLSNPRNTNDFELTADLITPFEPAITDLEEITVGANIAIENDDYQVPETTLNSPEVIFSNLGYSKDVLGGIIEDSFSDLDRSITNKLTDNLFNILRDVPTGAVSFLVDGVNYQIDHNEEQTHPDYEGNADQSICD